MKKQLLLLMMMLLPMETCAEAVEIDGLYYNLITKGKVAEVTSNPQKYSGNVIIPEKVNYDGVEYSVAILGEMAFFQCTGLTSVSIPNSVTSMGGGVFYGCTGLTSITIPNSITIIEYGMFSGCSALTSVDIPNSVTSIGSEAFRDCCGLTSITIPTSVINIRGSAFRDCSGLTSVHISDIAAWCMISFEDIYSNPLYAAHHLYLGNEEIKDLTIPQNITSIGQIAFAGCSGLASVTIPNNITNIGREAFFYCSGLTSITIPNSITSIESGVFQGCSGLTSVDYPNNLKEIKGAAFEMCTSLTSVIIPNSVTKIEDGIFQNCSSLTTLTIGNGIKEIWNVAFENCKELADVYCMAVDVPYTVPNAFDGSYIEFATLHVPEASISSYRAVEPWRNFKEIVPIEKQKYKLFYVINEEIYKSYEIEEGESITPEPAPKKEDYTFGGWSEIPETMPAHDITVTGSFFKKGDANGDNTVNAADIVEIVNYIEGNPSEIFNKTAADMNGDKEIDSTDLEGVVNSIMEKE